MSTERQQQASRANGSKSRGPVTPQGKFASSRNAITHGLLCGTIVLECESTDRFLSLVAALHEEFQPQTPFEKSLIENMAAARWRQRRIWGLEKAGMDHEMRRQSGLSNTISAEDNATRASLAFRTLSDDSRSLELINRYDSRFERQYYRAHRRFLEVRDLRTPPAPQPEPCLPEPPPPATLAPQIVSISKGTREVLENKQAAQAQVRCAANTNHEAQAQVRCAANTNHEAQAQVRCAANTNHEAQAQVRCAADTRQTPLRSKWLLSASIRVHSWLKGIFKASGKGRLLPELAA